MMIIVLCCVIVQASEYARVRGIPRIYIAANSGARIGMAESLKKLFKICWTDDTDPSKGFQYIYITKGIVQTSCQIM